jgi:hypothetical protein
MESLKTVNTQIEILTAKYSFLQAEFNKPNADFKTLSDQEDMISDCLSALFEVVREIENQNFEERVSLNEM